MYRNCGIRGGCFTEHIVFPAISKVHSSGVLALGGVLDLNSMIIGLQKGIYPVFLNANDVARHEPLDEVVHIFDRTTTYFNDIPMILAWISPLPRAVLFHREIHIPRSLKRFINKSKYSFTFNTNFTAVLEGCASANKREGNRWIVPPMIQVYTQAFQVGHAFSVECYEGDSLVGGLFGTIMGGYVSASSMFYTRPNASKLSLCWLAEQMGSYGVEWLDLQVQSDYLERLGARLVNHSDLDSILCKAVSAPQIKLT